jgi:hypothetical protein
MPPANGSGQSQILTYAIVLLLVCWAVYRRTRTQPVRLGRAVVTAGSVIALTAAGLAASWQGHALAFALGPVGLAAGFGLGWVLVGTMTFWRDEATGELWMKGGVLYLLIWLLTFALRFGVGYLAGEYSGGGRRTIPTGAWGTVSIDLLFLSIGLWAARAAGLVWRYQLQSSRSAPDN